MGELRGGGLHSFRPAVVAGHRRWGCVPDERLDHGEVGAGLEGHGHEGTPEIVRRAGRGPNLSGAFPEPGDQGLGGHGQEADNADLRDRRERRAMIPASKGQQGVDRCPGAPGSTDGPLPVSVADDAPLLRRRAASTLRHRMPPSRRCGQAFPRIVPAANTPCQRSGIAAGLTKRVGGVASPPRRGLAAANGDCVVQVAVTPQRSGSSCTGRNARNPRLQRCEVGCSGPGVGAVDPFERTPALLA